MQAALGFDRLARVYRTLEFAAFGRDLERARFALLDPLRDCTRILVLGEGDGRCLERLTQIAPQARIDCVDFSAAMLARAKLRLTPAQQERTRFLQLDVLSSELPVESYDAALTLFFLDCFTDAQLESLVPRIARRLRPGARWLWADFALPPRGLARLRARAWLKLLYAFFAWQTSLSARRLPDAERHIQASGLRLEERRVLRSGLLCCACFRAPRQAL
jgi:ubiquinone/menaquinone biosynthesis C-methylase UbiE